MLHSDLGTFEYLVLQSQMGNLTHSRGTHQWSTSFARGRQSAQIYYPRTEGIDCHDGRLFFVSKERKEQFVLDLDDETFTTTTTVSGMFDQIAYTRNGIVDKATARGREEEFFRRARRDSQCSSSWRSPGKERDSRQGQAGQLPHDPGGSGCQLGGDDGVGVLSRSQAYVFRLPAGGTPVRCLARKMAGASMPRFTGPTMIPDEPLWLSKII